MGLKYSIITPFTSFIAVEVRNEKISNSMTLQKIPLKIPKPQTKAASTKVRTGKAKISVRNCFYYESKSTIGVEFGTASAKVGDSSVKFQAWDTGTIEKKKIK
jgi:hypothetical protein